MVIVYLAPNSVRHVAAGGGRVMQCLLENTGQPEFGHQCMAQVAIRDSAMQSDFRENVPLAQACSSEIDTTCAAEKVQHCHR